MSGDHEAGRGWSEGELERIGGAEEIDIAPRRGDGTLGTRVTIWVAAHGADLYVRSWRGRSAGWFRGVETTRQGRIWGGGVEAEVTLEEAGPEVDDALDAVYRAKYRPHAPYVEDMVSSPARDATLKLLPR